MPSCPWYKDTILTFEAIPAEFPGSAAFASLKPLCEVAGRVCWAVYSCWLGFRRSLSMLGSAHICRLTACGRHSFPSSSLRKYLVPSPSCLGGKTRLAALLLAGYALLTAVIFHRHFADQIELVLLLTDVSIAGGLLLLVANGSGPLSLDHRGTNVRTLGALRDQCWGYRARSIPSSNRALSTLLA